MTSVPQLPGYYYDEEKKKYFKQQVGTPGNSVYSSENIKRRKLREEHTKAESVKAAARRGRIKRSAILTQGINGQHLSREHGKTDHVTLSNSFAASLVPYHCINTRYFTNDRQPKLAVSILKELMLLLPEISRVTESQYVSTWEGEIVVASQHRLTNVLLDPMISLSPGTSRDPTTSLYKSTPANFGSSLLFAISSSHGILTIDKRNLDMNWVTPKPINKANDSGTEDCLQDVFALEFLRDKEAVLLSGGRRGLLYTHDLKAPGIGRMSADIICHPSSITHIKQLNSHRIIVAGLESSLCQYDLRYLKRETYTSKSRTKTLNRHSTRPVLEYPDYFNTASILHGFDVDLETGVIVIGQEQSEQHPVVQLFSLEGGQVLASSQLNKAWGPRVPTANGRSIRLPPYGLKFARDTEHRSKSLYVGGEDGIHRFIWTSEDENALEDDRRKGGPALQLWQ
ncbi:hypothetical protein BJ875DRAFT_388378 [Amylocarpus encephaloides]|uniref:Uncharacterized protein n=1 Tax=Amylocarpus encephaloides TaxID=45428 RepID=A0A9P7Y8T7_9HELO|nr:hypothetical protein BJ875DRAFT_388378 [Amylocarpus encephaloides]